MKKLDDSIIKDIEESYKSGSTLKSISCRLNVSKATVSYYINLAGLSRYSAPVEVTEELLKIMQEDYDKGMSLRAIGKKYGIAFYRLNKLKKPTPKSNYSIVKSGRQRMKETLIQYKGGKCELCGYHRCNSALEFHHIDPSQKDFTIAQKNNYKNIEELKKELNKCILVCANCHREIHSGLIQLNINGK